MGNVLRILPWLAGSFISAIFVDSLRFKFTGHPTPEHIFTTLREWSGIGLFFPAGPWVIGLGELLSSFLLIVLPLGLLARGTVKDVARSQFAGAMLAMAIMSGAIAFHLFTPLGIETPVEWENGAVQKESAALFYSAVASWVCAALIMAIRKREL
ncbi:MAG: hypothetical protein AAFY83_01595 [Pseudomonadota bacterium]